MHCIFWIISDASFYSNFLKYIPGFCTFGFYVGGAEGFITWYVKLLGARFFEATTAVL